MTITLINSVKQIERNLFPGTLWQSDVTDKDLTAPPGSPSSGDRYIVARAATGAWAGQDDDIAEYNGSSWDFTTPSEDWSVWTTDESKVYHFDGLAWVEGVVNRELASQDNLEYYLNAALEEYSGDRPDTQTDDISGDGGKYYGIVSLASEWSEGFSRIIQLEYPAATIASDESPVYLEADDIDDSYWQSDTRYLFLPNHSPASTETMRITYTVPYTFSSGSANVPAGDFYAVCFLAASLAALAIASKFSQIGDSTINADSVNHASKASEFSNRAKEFRARYEDHLGLGEKEVSGPANAFVDWDTTPTYPSGRDFIFHTRGVR